jgi:hypothetical protein
MKRLMLLLLALTWLGCSAAPTLPQSQPLPAGVDFGGVWFSPQFEHMYVRQTGDEVRGIYAYKDGGTFEGVANGNLLTLTWIDPGNKEQARRSHTGAGYLQLVKEGEQLKLVGEWGYGESRTGGGPWEAEFVRELEADDPRNLEELFAGNSGE